MPKGREKQILELAGKCNRPINKKVDVKENRRNVNGKVENKKKTVEQNSSSSSSQGVSSQTRLWRWSHGGFS
jgi:hypothetical protein